MQMEQQREEQRREQSFQQQMQVYTDKFEERQMIREEEMVQVSLTEYNPLKTLKS